MSFTAPVPASFHLQGINHFEECNLRSDRDPATARAGVSSTDRGLFHAGNGEARERKRVKSHIAYELVQALDALVLQTVEQLPNLVQFFAALSRHRSAEDLASRSSSATFVSRHAAGGTAGGSADDSISSSSGFPSRSTTIQSRMVVVELPEVFKAFSLDTVR